LLFILLPWGGLTSSAYSANMQDEYEMPNKDAKPQVQKQQAVYPVQNKQTVRPAESKQARKQDLYPAQNTQTVHPEQYNPAERQALSKQAREKAKGKQTKPQAQNKQTKPQVQEAPKQQASPQFPVYKGYQKKKYSVQPVQRVAKQPAGHPSPTYSVYKTSKHSVHQVQGGYQQQGTSAFPIHTMQSQRIITTGAVYASTVFLPFDNTPPSSFAKGIAANSEEGPSGRRKFVDRPDINIGESPVGEPWILVAFAVLFGGVIAWRRKNNKIEL
jgi:hypothetical protein